MQWVADTVAGGLAYDILKFLVGPLVVSLLTSAVLKVAFHKLKERKEFLVFCGCTFFVCVVLFFFLGSRPERPSFAGGIQQAFSGPLPGSDRDTVAVLAINIINSGNMQSIVKNWKVQATINGNTYDGQFAQMPPTFTFNNIPKTTVNQPTSITFHADDSLLEKALKPIEVGSIVTGILFVDFPNVDQSVFRGAIKYDVYYEDVLSRPYKISIQGNGQVGQIGSVAGLHTDMACPIPPGGLPKIQTNPLATPVPSAPN